MKGMKCNTERSKWEELKTVEPQDESHSMLLISKNYPPKFFSQEIKLAICISDKPNVPVYLNFMWFPLINHFMSLFHISL